MRRWWLIVLLLPMLIIPLRLITRDVGSNWPQPPSAVTNPMQEQMVEELYDQFQLEITNLLAEYDRRLQQRWELLQQQGERQIADQRKTFEEKLEANVDDFHQVLASEAQEIEQELLKRYQTPIVNTKLRLLLVRLSAYEQRELENELARLQQELEVERTALDQELVERLSDFRHEETGRITKEMDVWEQSYVGQLNQDYLDFEARLHQEYETELRKREDALGRSVHGREY